MNEIAKGVLSCMRVLIVEDEHLVAMALTDDLEEAGAIVVGPATTVDSALALVELHPLDAAVLDIRLDTQLVFPVADMLVERGVPFLFTTGYDSGVVPSAYAHVPTCEKPASASTVLETLANLRGKSG